MTHQLSDFSEPKPCVYVAALTAPEACRGDEHAVALARTPVEIEQALAGLDACLESLSGPGTSENSANSALTVATRNQCLGALHAAAAPVTLSPTPPTVAVESANELIAVESAIDAASPPLVAENVASVSEASVIPTRSTLL